MDGLTSLRLLRTMFSEYQLCGWHIVSSNLSNQRLIVDFKFHTGPSNRRQEKNIMGPSTLFCMQIVKQLYTFLKIRQWTIVSGDRNTEIVHFSFTFEFKKDLSRLPSSCLKSIIDKNHHRSRHARREENDEETLMQLMNIVRDLEKSDDGFSRSKSVFNKSSTSGAVTENFTDGSQIGGDSLILTSPAASGRGQKAWFNEHESDSDANDQRVNEELANWRMGIRLRSPPFGCSTCSESSISFRSRSAIRRPIPRRPCPLISTSNSTQTDTISSDQKSTQSRSRSATAAQRISISRDTVDPCFLKRPTVGDGELIGKRKELSVKTDSDCGISQIPSCSGKSYAKIDDQCSMCKKKSVLEKECDSCSRNYCAECMWWCIITKRRRCLMCYNDQ